MGCFFCDIQKNNKKNKIFENDFFFSRFDNYPVSKGHALVITKKHLSSFFDLNEKELAAMNEVLKRTKDFVDKKFNPDGYNIGINEKEAGGQSINHLHVHLIPRYRGDVDNPIGGVRNVVPGKGDYLSNDLEKI